MTSLTRDGGVTLLDILSQGESFAELAVLDGAPHVDTALAAGQTRLACVQFPPEFCNGVLAPLKAPLEHALSILVARRARAYIESIRVLSLSNLQARLARILLSLVKKFKTTRKVAGHIYPALPSFITQSDLGALARGTRGNINRLLKNWEMEGWLISVERSLVFLDLDKISMLRYAQEA